MIGIDTTLLVELAHAEHAAHAAAKRLVASMAKEKLYLAPQVIAEFIHVITDAKRFQQPLEMGQAIALAEQFWHASEVFHAFPNGESMAQTLKWLAEHRLGRKRILDTQLAATYYCAGIRRIATSNGRDFSVFGVFEILQPT